MTRLIIQRGSDVIASVAVGPEGLVVGPEGDVILPDWTGPSLRVFRAPVGLELWDGRHEWTLTGRDGEEPVAHAGYLFRTETTHPDERRLTRELELGPDRSTLTVRETVIEISDDSGAPGRVVELPEGRLVFGKDPGCDVVLTDAYVSARHLAVDTAGDAAVVRDLDSRNGVFLDGQRISAGEWRTGQTLVAGRTRLTLRRRESVEPLGDSDARVPGLVGRHPVIRRLAELVHRAAATDITVLIHGETGTGKELVARGLHALSARAPASFIAVNCGAVPRDLFESELFGHVKGAFSGAVRDRRGLFAAASGGTLFLDEIGELPAEVQARLLRVLDDRRIRPVGAEREQFCDVRVVAATHRDLDELADQGRFRRDLLFRLRMLPLEIPPLRARLSDLDDLVRHLIEREASAQAKPAPGIDDKALADLRRYAWPGNVRELAGVLARALILAGPGATIRPEHLQFPGAVNEATLTLEDIEREAVRRAVEQEPNREAAARRLGIAVSTLYEKIKKYDLR